MTGETHTNKYLLEVWPLHDFVVEEIKKHESNKSRNRSFKVSLDVEILEEVMKPEVWPDGVLVRRFVFFRGSTAAIGQQRSRTSEAVL